VMSTGHDQVDWQRQFHHHTHYRHPISPGDVTYVLASVVLSGMRVIPVPQRIRLIGKASPLLARLLYTANLHPTGTIRSNMNAVLGTHRRSDTARADVLRLISLIVWNSLVISILPALTQQQIVGLVPIDGISYLDDYLTSRYPVLVWGYHFGIETLIIPILLHARGYPVHAITHVRQMPALGNVLQARYYRQLQPVSIQLPVIDPRKGVQREILDVLRSKECLYVTPDYMIPEGDRHPESAFEVPIDFLGRKAYLQTGALRLAKRLGAKVVTVLSSQADGHNRRLIVEPFELPTSGLAPAELQQDLQTCMSRLEAQVLAHPYWWLDLKRDDLVRRLRDPQAELGKGLTF
jgi:lauroyl/myristoyl acyltransferase